MWNDSSDKVCTNILTAQLKKIKRQKPVVTGYGSGPYVPYTLGHWDQHLLNFR